jgi:aminoglycoside 6'-N-acetyltransferase
VSLSTETDSIHGKPARGGVSLRPATPEDLELLRRWDAAPHVIAATGDEDWHWETELARNPDGREQLIAEVDGRPIG